MITECSLGIFRGGQSKEYNLWMRMSVGMVGVKFHARQPCVYLRIYRNVAIQIVTVISLSRW